MSFRAGSALAAALIAVTTHARPHSEPPGQQRLRELAKRASARFEREHAEAEKWARANGDELRQEHADGGTEDLLFLRDGLPFARETRNAAAADTISADELWPGRSAGTDLTGDGVVIHVWDAGQVRSTHIELLGAVTWADDTAPRQSDHATHVAGTLVALGVQPPARGTAFGASIRAYDWADDVAEMAEAAAGGARLAAHAYGWIRGWHWNEKYAAWYWYGDPKLSKREDARFGFYDSTAAEWDELVCDAPYFLICKAAGNDTGTPKSRGHYAWNRGQGWKWSKHERQPNGGAHGYDTIGQQAAAKNVLTVGAVDDIPGGYTGPGDVVVTKFSAKGPTDDGRIKPDLVANGVGLWSTVASGDADYDARSGTSMACASATGALALLIEQQRATHDGSDLRASTLKGLVIHTADECGPAPGPDYAFGWGLLNAESAARHIALDGESPHLVQELTLADGDVISQEWLADGTRPVKATICWTDPPGTPPAPRLDPPDRMLADDLDLRIIGPDGAVYEPWILDPDDPAAPATRGDNSRDNVEVVVIEAPVEGPYTFEITHKGSLAQGTRDVSLILSEGLSAPAPPPPPPPPTVVDAGPPFIVWRHVDNGRNVIWFMEGSTRLDFAQMPARTNLSWYVAGSGDFDGDGRADLLWRRADNALNQIWFLEGVSPEPQSLSLPNRGAAWLAAATSDIDGDGLADILWRHTGDGRNQVWFMDGADVRPESGFLPDRTSQNWHVAAVADFDGDGDGDILWRRADNGLNQIWRMDGTSLAPEPLPLDDMGTNWFVAASGDFDGDGLADILWHNAANGSTRVWFMDGAAVRPESGDSVTRGGAWAARAAVDFDSDGDDDVLWRNANTGDNQLWLMEGTSLDPAREEVHSVGTVWDIAAADD